jgi:hypothetical protein
MSKTYVRTREEVTLQITLWNVMANYKYSKTPDIVKTMLSVHRPV